MPPEITSDPDWIRERELDREIQAREEQVDRQFRELRESEVVQQQQKQQQQPSIPYESSKRHSRNIRTTGSGQLSFDSPAYEPQVEGEELPYIVTDEDAQHSRKSSRNPQQLYISEAEHEAGVGGVVGARYTKFQEFLTTIDFVIVVFRIYILLLLKTFGSL